jgi:hypothetical protein
LLARRFLGGGHGTGAAADDDEGTADAWQAPLSSAVTAVVEAGGRVTAGLLAGVTLLTVVMIGIAGSSAAIVSELGPFVASIRFMCYLLGTIAW